MSYLFLKALHVGCVVVSGSLFVVRAWLTLGRHSAAAWRVWRILPHGVDTLLLGSAIGLAVLTRQYPLVHAWLTVKLLVLVAYVVFGSIALKRGRTPTQRRLALVAALLSFAFIVSVALTHSPWGWWALLPQ